MKASEETKVNPEFRSFSLPLLRELITRYYIFLPIVVFLILAFFLFVVPFSIINQEPSVAELVYSESSDILVLHRFADLTVGVAFLLLSVIFFYLAQKLHHDSVFKYVFIIFGLMVVLIGIAHMTVSWSTWYPSLWALGVKRLMTGIIAVLSVGASFFVIPKVLRIIHSVNVAESNNERLEKVNDSLEKEINERRKVESELLRRELWLNEAQRLSNVGSWEWDIKTGEFTWSKQMYELFTEPVGEFSPSLDRQLNYVHTDDRVAVETELTDLKNQKETNQHEFRIITRRGETRSVHSSRKIIFDDNGEPQKVIGTIQDISEHKTAFDTINELNFNLKRRTTQLENSNEELEAFSYSVSHDLRAPIRAINGFSSALLEEYGSVLDKEGLEYISRISEAVANMKQLIDDLLRLSNITRKNIEMKTVDLSGLAGEIVNSIRRQEPDRNVEVKIEPNLSTKGDEGLFRIALENLLMNAWKFTGRNPHAEIRFGMQNEGKSSVFFIKDNGAGFNMQYIEDLFTPFQRLHHKADFDGTGVGLAIVKRVIRRHGGKVWAEGELGKGATFYFKLT